MYATARPTLAPPSVHFVARAPLAHSRPTRPVSQVRRYPDHDPEPWEVEADEAAVAKANREAHLRPGARVNRIRPKFGPPTASNPYVGWWCEWVPTTAIGVTDHQQHHEARRSSPMPSSSVCDRPCFPSRPNPPQSQPTQHRQPTHHHSPRYHHLGELLTLTLTLGTTTWGSRCATGPVVSWGRAWGGNSP